MSHSRRTGRAVSGDSSRWSAAVPSIRRRASGAIAPVSVETSRASSSGGPREDRWRPEACDSARSGRVLQPRGRGARADGPVAPWPPPAGWARSLDPRAIARERNWQPRAHVADAIGVDPGDAVVADAARTVYPPGGGLARRRRV